MAQTTKIAIAMSLKKLLEKKTLSQISVVDLANECEINRHTFYYHFQDIYELIEWIYQREATKALDGKKTYDTWQEGFLQLFKYALANKNFVMNTYRSISEQHLINYLYKITYSLLIDVMEEKAEGMRVSDENKKFIANFYKYAFVGLVREWIESEMKTQPENIIEKLTILIEGDFVRALERFRTASKN